MQMTGEQIRIKLPAEMIDGADILKALRLFKVVQQGHCDTCAINKTRLPPRPEGKTTRPTREARVLEDLVQIFSCFKRPFSWY